jgi:hypothetical protein
VPIVTPLTNAVPVTVSGNGGSTKLFKITLPSGQPRLSIAISGGTGDCDLYVRRGSPPTTSSWDYRPFLGGNNESVDVGNPNSGDWYVLLYGFESYSSLTLTARYGPGNGSTLVNAAAIGLGYDMLQEYNQGRKYLFTASGDLDLASVFTAGIAKAASVGVAVYLDLADYVGVTEEGWNGGWVTIWGRAHGTAFGVGLSLPGVNFRSALETREFNSSTQLPDREFPFAASLFSLSGFVRELTFLSYSVGEGGQVFDPGVWQVSTSAGLGIGTIETQSVSVEVQRAVLDSFLANGIVPSMSVSQIGRHVMLKIINPDQSSKLDGVFQPTWRLPVRYPGADKSDNTN